MFFFCLFVVVFVFLLLFFVVVVVVVVVFVVVFCFVFLFFCLFVFLLFFSSCFVLFCFYLFNILGGSPVSSTTLNHRAPYFAPPRTSLYVCLSFLCSRNNKKFKFEISYTCML